MDFLAASNLCRRLAPLLASLLLAGGAAAQQGGDLQAQILYAYHTEDANGLAGLTETLASQVKAEPADATLRYHLAHALYRRGLLARAAAREAESAFSDCVDVLKPLAAQDVKSTEALILQSACYGALAEHRKLEAALLRSRAEDRLKAALAAEPRNPRALLLSAQNQLARARPGTSDRQRADAQLEAAARSFDASSSTSPDAPGWGHADAYLTLGGELEARGDHLGARNWIEKALISAPDYKAAQRQLAALSRP